MFLKFNQYTNALYESHVSGFLFEGGSFGHMSHPYDDVNLTFGEIKNIISSGLQGGLDKEIIPTEKLDGQAIAISWRNGELIASRNQGDRKNAGASSLSVQQVIDKFAGRGEISDAFSFAIQDLSSAISKIDPKKRDKIFNNGKSFMHLELIYPPTTNVVNYDAYKLIFHNTSDYDMDGNEIGQSKTAASILTKLIKEVNADIQKTYQIDPPKSIQFKDNLNYEADRAVFFKELAKIQKDAGLSDSQSIKDYIVREFTRKFEREATKNGYDIAPNHLEGLINRFAFLDNSFSIRHIKRSITNEGFRDWVLDFAANKGKKAAAFYKEVIGPIEVLFLKLGTKIIKNASGFLALNPEKETDRIKKELESAVKKVRSSGNEKEVNKLEQNFRKLEAIGGFESVVPTEGIVFQYKGKTYKLTGSFAPVNQILGIIKYMKK
jgi:hypothetical protein